MGIDQEKLDKLKEEIEQTETAIEALSKDKPHNELQKKELQAMENKLEKLKEALREQASERARDTEKPEHKAQQLAAQYLKVEEYR